MSILGVLKAKSKSAGWVILVVILLITAQKTECVRKLDV